MNVLYENGPLTPKNIGMGLGNFDGLHIGHMSLVSALIAECEKRGIKSMIYTFKEHSANVLGNKKKIPQIITVEKKIQLLSRTKLDYIYLENFTYEYAGLSCENFVKNILVDKFNVKFVVVGFNYTFGKMGAGTAEELKLFGEKYGFDVFVIPPIRIGRETVSSTLVRKYVKNGLMDKARICLGRYYSIYGTVKMGRQIGSTIGFPTANIIPEDYLVMPKSGVYVTCTVLDGELYNSITNIGKNPTFGELKNISCETHIFSREGNLYGKRIEVFFMAKLRGERKFDSKEELCSQINSDIIAAREFFNDLL